MNCTRKLFRQFRPLAAGLAALVWLAAPSASAQDAFGYTASSQVPFSYVNIAATGTAVLAGMDDASATLTLPFAFRFYGTSYTNLCVSTNGLISFGSCVPGDVTNLDLTAQAPSGNQPLIAPFWMDLSFAPPGAGAVVYQTLGAAPSRMFVVQWNGVFGLNAPGALNFQAILNEGSNAVLFQYQTIECGAAGVSRGASATVGIRGPNGQANGYRYQWSYRAPLLANSMAIKFTAPAAVSAVDVSGQVRATTSAFLYNRLTGRYSGTVTVTNIGGVPIAAPLTIVLTNLTSGVTAVNPSGTLPGQGPYYGVPVTGSLLPGSSATVPVQFTNPANARISFVVKTYSGSF